MSYAMVHKDWETALNILGARGKTAKKIVKQSPQVKETLSLERLSRGVRKAQVSLSLRK